MRINECEFKKLAGQMPDIASALTAKLTAVGLLLGPFKDTEKGPKRPTVLI